MAANFQHHMGGVGQMMPQQQQQQVQRIPQPTGASTQIQQLIFQTLNQQTGPLTGWQAQVLVQERMALVFNIIGNLRLASQNQPNTPTLNKMIEIGIKFEKDIFEKSPDKATYKHEVQVKLDQLVERRNQNQQNLQQSINLQAQAQAAQAAQAQMMMNQNGMQGQVPRAIPQQPTQQGFHHLQHQMQASPLPGQQPQQMPMGMSNEGMPQNMTPNQQQQFQMAMQQPPQQQPQQQQNMPGRQQIGQPPLSQADASLVMELSNRMMSQASETEKANLRANLQGRMDPGTLQRYQSQGVDPLFLYYRNQALQKLRQEKQAHMQAQSQAQAQLSISQQQQQQNVLTTAPPMQQQRSMNPSPLNGQTQSGGNPDFGSFVGNMGNLIDQQQQGVMAQEAGQMVVPASAAQRNPTPQPGVMAGQQMNVADQRAVPNPNSRAQHQQQMFNAQQNQQQRLQHAAQQQSQAAARQNAQAKAQQIGLQGQPGGMGNGPMPPQQSPAMGTLNAPLRTPSQQMNNSEQPQLNPNAQFGQPLDPRFMQGNGRQLGPGNAMNGSALNTMFAAMPQEQQQRLAGLPPEKLNEVVNKWHEQRAQQMNAANVQAGRPQMPMQGNNQMRPGQQVPQPGQFNPQNSINQFMMANPGQRPPQSMTPGMTPQQQMMLQQQMGRMNQNPLQQRTGPPNLTPNEQRTIMQMDSVDFPTSLLNHAHMPRGIPQEIKKWGLLKQWASQNSAIGPDTIENIKTLQKMHFQQIMRAKNGNQQPGMGQPIGMPLGGQGAIPMVPPGMSAPVAPMGQNPMQIMNGMTAGQTRQPTQLEIQQARNHASGKMAQATDDQIRAFLMKHNSQLTQQQQQQRQNQLLQMQMANQMAQGQQARQGLPPGQAQQNMNSMGPGQPLPGQIPQSKPQPISEQSAPAPAILNNNRTAPRPTTSGRAAPPANSSPAQPAKNLKRASSDDVVEVPNPNVQQPARPAPQNVQGQRAVPQQPRPELTPQQIAALDPEARKKYEKALQAWQASRASNTNAADMAKLRSIMEEEVQRSREPMPDIPMDPDTKVTMLNLLRDILNPLNNVGKAVPKWFQITHDESRARIFFRTRHRLQKQFQDNEMTRPRDVFSIRPAEIEQARVMLSGMVKDLSDRFPKMKKPEAAQSQPVAPSQLTATATQPAAGSTVPLNAANLQQQQQQLNKIHQRSGSRSSHTPAAPTSAQPPFPFGASSPHGAPAYIGKTAITQENLHIPARKKQKPNNAGQNTSGSNISPQVIKAVSPEIKRQPAPEVKPQPKPSLCCSEPECDRHNVGFDSEEALRLHTQEEHIRPLENPVIYAQENLASLLGLDSQGRSKNQTVSTSQEPGAAPAEVKMSASGSKQGQTPNIKGENTPAGVTTPMNRQVSMNRQGSGASARPTAQSKAKAQPDSTKDGMAKLQAGQNDPAKQATQQGQDAAIVDPWANATIDPHDLFQSFQEFESGAGGAISDMNVYRSITPNDTPESSKDGVSEPNSDISEGVGLDINLDIFDDNWMPFGPTDTDFLDMSSFNANSGEDVMFFNEEQPVLNYQSWDDMVDPSVFDKPFSFDTSMYSMNAD